MHREGILISVGSNYCFNKVEVAQRHGENVDDGHMGGLEGTQHGGECQRICAIALIVVHVMVGREASRQLLFLCVWQI